MAYCGQCGAPLARGAEFCVGCGAPLDAAARALVNLVDVQCPLCAAMGTVAPGSTAWRCGGCGRQWSFVRCKMCGGPTQVTLGVSPSCVWCGDVHRGSFAPNQSLMVEMVAAEFARRGVAVDASDPERHTLYSCVILAAAGMPLSPGVPCTMMFARDGVSVTEIATGRGVRVSYDDIREIELGGPGAMQSGGGFIGGGFGVGGIIGGIALAAALNKLTTRTAIQTLIRIAAPRAELIVSHDRTTPEQLRIYLSPAFARLAAAHERTTIAPPVIQGHDVVAQLERLAEMKAAGVVTDQEFEAAKAKILHGG
jgi:hypothetical protein